MQLLNDMLKSYQFLDPYIEQAANESMACYKKTHEKIKSGFSNQADGNMRVLTEFYFNKNESIAVSLHLPGTKWFHYPVSGSKKPMHNHDFYEINYIYHGNAKNYLSDCVINQSTNQVLLMHPYAIHFPEIESEDTLLFNILIRREFSTEAFSTIHLSDINLTDVFFDSRLGVGLLKPFLLLNNTPLMTFILHQIIIEYYERKPCYQQIMYANIVKLWALFMRQKFESQEQNKDDNYSGRKNEIISFIEKNCCNINLKEAARQFNFAPNYFSQYIKKITGYRFNEIIHFFKMKKAQELLIYTNKTVKEIVEMLGFNDVSYFMKVFKKDFELSPGAYRNQYQSK